MNTVSLVLKTVKLLLIKRSVELKSSSLAIVCVHFWTKSCCMVNSFVFLLQQIDYQKNQTSEKNQEQIFDTYKKSFFVSMPKRFLHVGKGFFHSHSMLLKEEIRELMRSVLMVIDSSKVPLRVKKMRSTDNTH